MFVIRIERLIAIAVNWKYRAQLLTWRLNWSIPSHGDGTKHKRVFSERVRFPHGVSKVDAIVRDVSLLTSQAANVRYVDMVHHRDQHNGKTSSDWGKVGGLEEIITCLNFHRVVKTDGTELYAHQPGT